MVTRYKSRWFEHLLDEIEAEEEHLWVQIELPLEHTLCAHKFYDDGDNFAIVCAICGVSHSVSFIDPYDGKTYQEIYEMMQKDRKLK